MIFTIILGFQKNNELRCTLRKDVTTSPSLQMRGTKVQFIQTELKGLMDHTAYLILKKNVDPERIRVKLFSFLPPLSLCPRLRPAEERQTGRRRAAASVGFTVATETMSSLLNTCF